MRSYFKDHAPHLMANGYPVIPIKPSSKAPAISDWNHARLTETDVPKYAQCGVGIPCGQGEYPLAGIDLDIRLEALAERARQRVYDLIGVLPERIGKAPKMLFLVRTDKPLPKKITSRAFKDAKGQKCQIELLGKNNQCVVYGTHPDTQEPYQWNDLVGDGPFQGHISELPVVTLEQLRELIRLFEDDAIALGLTPMDGSAANAVQPQVDDGDDPFADYVPLNDLTMGEARALLQHLDSSAEYGYWIQIGMALHHEFEGSEEALDLWDEWSSTSSKYKDPGDLRSHWESFKDKKADKVTAIWLRAEARLQKQLATAFSHPPQEIISSLPAAPVFDPALLPKPLADFVLDQADLIRCPPEYIAAAVVVSFGSVIGARCAAKPKRHGDWIVTPNLYGAIVGEPSSRKTPAGDSVIKIMRGLEAREAQKLEEAMKEYSAEMAVYAAMKTAANKTIEDAIKGKADMEQATAQLKGLVEPEKPLQRRFIVNDSTVAKLGDILVGNPQGVLVFCDELTGLIASWDKKGNEGDKAFYLTAHNGTLPFSIDRIGRGSLLVNNLCLSLMGGIQPELLERYLSEMANSLDNDGRFQRFQVLVYPESVQWEWVDRRPIEGTREYVRDAIERLAYFDPVEYGAQPANEFIKLPYFRFDDGAIKVFKDWSARLHRSIEREENPLISQHYGKYEKLFCSIALIMHLAADRRGDIKADSAQMAVAWCDYLSGHARRIYGLLDAARVKTAQALGRHIRDGKLPDRFTAHDVWKKGWTGLSTSMEAEKALDVLESFGWVARYEVEPGKKGGRPTPRYAIHPSLQVKKS